MADRRRHERRSAGLAARAGLLRAPALADDLERELRRRGATAVSRARALWERAQLAARGARRARRRRQARSPAALIDRCGASWPAARARRCRAPRTVLAGEQAARRCAHAAAARALGELRELAVPRPELAPERRAGAGRRAGGVEFLGGRPTGGDAVAVLDPLALRARRVRALFLCGLQEGVFPSQRRAPQPALRGGPRRAGAPHRPAPRPPRDPLAAERYLLYAAVSRPEELLVLSWHVADDEGRRDERSLFVEDVCDLFEERAARAAAGARAPGAVPTAPGARGRAATRGSGDRLAPRRARAGRAGRPPWSASQLEKIHRLPDAVVRGADPAARLAGTPTPSRCAAGGSPTPR